MALRGKKPTAEDKRLKALFFGAPGVGKTTAAIQFPKPYLIDTERGAENERYVELLTAAGGVIFQTAEFDEMVDEVRALLTEPHDYKTLIIDPVTTVYNDLIENAEKKVGTEFGRHFGEAKKRWKHLNNLVLRLDMNVIFTSHEKNLYGDNLTLLGKTYDGPKGLDYLFDLAFEIQRRGNDRVGVVRKTRMDAFPESDVFPFSYDEIAERYGRAILERDAVPQELASTAQVAELERLVGVLKVDQDTVDKWLNKAKADSFAEMPSDSIQKCIDFLKKQIKEAG